MAGTCGCDAGKSSRLEGCRCAPGGRFHVATSARYPHQREWELQPYTGRAVSTSPFGQWIRGLRPLSFPTVPVDFPPLSTMFDPTDARTWQSGR